MANKLRSFRIGTTSWIIEAGLVENARHLGGRADDMELVLFDLPDGKSNLPNSTKLAALKKISQETGLSYTVHLPLDLRMGHDGYAEHASLELARRVIDITKILQPYAWVAHIDGKGRIHNENAWIAQAGRAIQSIAAEIDDPALLAIENLEGSPPGLVDEVLQTLPELRISRCVDVGHLWLDGHDALPWLQQALPRLRVVHMHGLAFDPARGRLCDHTSVSLDYAPKAAAVIKFLEKEKWTGLITIEVFSKQELLESLNTLVPDEKWF